MSGCQPGESAMVNADWGAFGRSLATLARCLLCGGASQRFGLCDPCREELPYVDHGCAGCALALPEAAAAGLCLGCLRRRPPFDHAFALLHYEYPADRCAGGIASCRRQLCRYRCIASASASAVSTRRSNWRCRLRAASAWSWLPACYPGCVRPLLSPGCRHGRGAAT
jgi:hypothetical protein